MYNSTELIENIQYSVDRYYHINDYATIPFYAKVDPELGELAPIVMNVEYRYEAGRDDPERVYSLTYNLTHNDPLGPFNVTRHKLKSLLKNVALIHLEMPYTSDLITQYFTITFLWKVDVTFARNGGIFLRDLTVSYIPIIHAELIRVGWIHYYVLTLSVTSALMGIDSLLTSIFALQRNKKKFNSIPSYMLTRIYKRLKIKPNKRYYSWEDIPLRVKVDFFAFWDFVELSAELGLIFSSVYGLYKEHGFLLSGTTRIVTGICCLIVNVNVLQYFDSWKKFYTLVLTLQYASTTNIPFLVSVFPLFLGFLGCGLVSFSHYTEDFSTVDNTASTLFALLKGDLIKDIFEDLNNRIYFKTFGRIFLFSFVLLFISVVLKLFIRMMEDSYTFAKSFIALNEQRLSRRIRKMHHLGAVSKIVDPDFDIPTLFDILETAEQMNPNVFTQDEDADMNVLDTVSRFTVSDMSDFKPLMENFEEEEDEEDDELASTVKEQKEFMKEMQIEMKALQKRFIVSLETNIKEMDLM